MKTAFKYLSGLVLLLTSACEKTAEKSQVQDGILKTIGWQGDDRAVRIFEDSLGYLVFGSSNSFAPGDYDGIIMRLGHNLDRVGFGRYGTRGDEMLLGAEPTRDLSGKTNGYIAWGTRRDPGKRDKDLWLLMVDATGIASLENTIAIGNGAIDDIPVALHVGQSGMLAACNTARLTPAGFVETVAWVKTDARSNERWRLILPDTLAIKADGVIETAFNKAIGFCHTAAGELRMVEITDPVLPTDTPAWRILNKYPLEGLQEGGQWQVGPDNNLWFYCTVRASGIAGTRLLKFDHTGTFIQDIGIGNGTSEQNGRLTLHDTDPDYPVKMLSTQKRSAGSAQSQMAVYFCDHTGIKQKQPMHYGGDYINVAADLLPTRSGKLLLLGSSTAPNKAGADFLLCLLNEEGELP